MKHSAQRKASWLDGGFAENTRSDANGRVRGAWAWGQYAQSAAKARGDGPRLKVAESKYLGRIAKKFNVPVGKYSSTPGQPT